MTTGPNKLTLAGQLGLAALAGLLSVMSLVALASRQKEHTRTASLLQGYQSLGRPDQQNNPAEQNTPAEGNKKETKESKNQKKQKSPQKELAERIGKRPVFSVVKPKALSLKLIGVLGQYAYFEGEAKGFKVGDTHKEAKIKEIGADWVEVEFEGKPKKYYVFGEDKKGPDSSKEPPASPESAPPDGPSRRPPRGPGRPGPGDMELTPERIERFKSMPEEIRKKALETMPPEMREKLEKEL